MFHFTIRDVLWLTVVVGLSHPAMANEHNFKSGDRVYFRYMQREGYGTVRNSDSFYYYIEPEKGAGKFRIAARIPRRNVYESFDHANKRQVLQDPKIPDLERLYQAIGVATGWCLMAALLVGAAIYTFRRRSKNRSDTGIDAEVLQ